MSTLTQSKTDIELKREYWSQPHLYFTPKMIEALVQEYGDKPATSGEAFYVFSYRCRELGRSLAASISDIWGTKA